MLKKIAIIYLIVAFVSACTPTYTTYNVSTSGSSQTGEAVSNGLAFKYQSFYFDQGGFDIDWKITNIGQKPIHIDLANFNCTNTQGTNSRSKQVYVEDRTNSSYNDEQYKADDSINPILLILGIITVVGIIAILMAHDSDDDTREHSHHRHHHHDHDYDSNNITVVNDYSTTVITNNNYNGTTTDTDSTSGNSSLTPPVIHDPQIYDSHTLQPGKAAVFNIRCPIIPFTGESRLSVVANIGKFSQEKVYRVSRKSQAGPETEANTDVQAYDYY